MSTLREMSAKITKGILLAYYSRTGVTRQVAEELAKLCDCDVEQILDVQSRTGVMGYLRSGWEAWSKRPSSIRPLTHDALQYDLVVIGTPVWASSMSAPIRCYIAENGRKFNRIALFCTLGGAGAERALEQMAWACHRTPVATLAVTESDVRADRHRQAVDDFAKTLRFAIAAHPTPVRQQRQV